MNIRQTLLITTVLAVCSSTTTGNAATAAPEAPAVHAFDSAVVSGLGARNLSLIHI